MSLFIAYWANRAKVSTSQLPLVTEGRKGTEAEDTAGSAILKMDNIHNIWNPYMPHPDMGVERPEAYEYKTNAY